MNGKYVVVDDWNAVNAGQVVSVNKRVEVEIVGLVLTTTLPEATVLLRWPSDRVDARDEFYKVLVDMMAKVE